MKNKKKRAFSEVPIIKYRRSDSVSAEEAQKRLNQAFDILFDAMREDMSENQQAKTEQ